MVLGFKTSYYYLLKTLLKGLVAIIPIYTKIKKRRKYQEFQNPWSKNKKIEKKSEKRGKMEEIPRVSETCAHKMAKVSENTQNPSGFAVTFVKGV